MKTIQDTHNGDLAVGTPTAKPHHRLWNINGTWWLHYTVYTTPVTIERKRISLDTRDFFTASSRRDTILAAVA